MRNAATLALVSLLVAAPGPISAQARPSADAIKQTLTGVYQQFLDGLRTRDTVALSKLLTEDYTFTLSDDSVVTMNRAQRLRSIAADQDSLPNLSLERCDFQLYGAAATGQGWIRERNATQARWVAIVSTVTMIRGVERKWRLASVHAALVPPRKPGRLPPGGS
jgi:hypothetical protein